MVKDARQVGKLLGAGSQVGASEGMRPGSTNAPQMGEGTFPPRALIIAFVLSPTLQNRQSQIKELTAICASLSEHQEAPFYFIYIKYHPVLCLTQTL